jgi:lysozyme family protein
MKTPFERALENTLGFEGGEAHHPLDRGGHTYRGITQGLYDRWRRKKGREYRRVTEIDESEIEAIAMEEFWLPCRCNDLPGDVAVAVFDMAFHSGVGDARRALQRAVRVEQDGILGEQTLAAVRLAEPKRLIRDFLKARGAELQEILIRDQSQVIFLEGWINRIIDQVP